MNDPLPLLPPREPDAHKGDFGTALVIGGSRGMSGAAGLAGMAALRGGAGLVRVAVPEVCLDSVAGFEPCYTTIPLPCDEAGRISAAALPILREEARNATALALGPGLGRSAQLDELVAALYREIEKPLIVDADALNALATQPDVYLLPPAGPRILTPHPGEFARLIRKKLEGEKTGTGSEPTERGSMEKADREVPVPIFSPRQQAAIALAAKSGAVVLLKGHRTLITDGWRRVLNSTGNPGMATGGSGDVLTGLIAALLCQRLSPFDAARLAAHLHGLAGDLAAKELGEVSLIARDLIEFLPKAFLRMSEK
ncbi:MAG: NAD(P)H-hydrate dehydratase [Pirellulales bacterium]|nr:NAD(P)H-hydrate dehydratase [Pirellulales bacterium]